jgi:hypothetical protein
MSRVTDKQLREAVDSQGLSLSDGSKYWVYREFYESRWGYKPSKAHFRQAMRLTNAEFAEIAQHVLDARKVKVGNKLLQGKVVGDGT